MFFIQLLLQPFQQASLPFIVPPVLTGTLLIGGVSFGGDASPQLPLSPQSRAHLQSLGSLSFQLDLELLHTSVETQVVLFSLLGELRGGLPLLLQGLG